MSTLADIRSLMQNSYMEPERAVLETLVSHHGPDKATREAITASAVTLIEQIRADGTPYLMEAFLAEYGLSTNEGVALMCLAEALLRVPDDQTIDELIEDKIAPSSWSEHLGQSSSPLVNASTWALMLTSKVLRESAAEGIAETLHEAVRRVGEPVIRVAVKHAMKEMGHQFVLGRNIKEAIKRGEPQKKEGYTFSYDMLGEAALTASDADGFFKAYEEAIKTLTANCHSKDSRDNPGISVKLSALHPRYEVSQKERVLTELVPHVKRLALMAKDAQMGFNIDAEEADRLEISLEVIEAVLRSPELAGWDGFGVVVQAYGKRASHTIDWLYSLASELDRHIMVRLVKGAYWDSEIKQAQVDGLEDFPVFTNKAATDISYFCCAQKLFNYTDRIYPQFATHNARTVSAILNLAQDNSFYEFQRLHGMGEALHDSVLKSKHVRCRIYAPVGAHHDLLAYLVRRLLENGANSSFVNQIVDPEVSPAEIASDPFELLTTTWPNGPSIVDKPNDLYLPERANSLGWNLRNYQDIEKLNAEREPFKHHQWTVAPMLADQSESAEAVSVYSPSSPEDCIGFVSVATPAQVEQAISAAVSWSTTSAQERCRILNAAADLYETNSGEIFAALAREAGKSLIDAIAEIREAVDFLRYYACESIRLADKPERGVITCISPWNFPLAIFSGQIAASLAAGNGVLAKPAEPTPIVATIGTRLLHEAGVPKNVLQLLPGDGSSVGVKLTSDSRINGICFTGSTAVAQQIYRASSKSLEPDSTFIAETGGLNTMIVDSTALPEQAIQDIVDSAFQSGGQRCSALRMLYVQEDIAEAFMEMLFGAMDELRIAEPWNLSTDIGPIINRSAHKKIDDYVKHAKSEGNLLKQLDVPSTGLFIGPSVVKTDGVLSLEEEIFGPVLHITTFDASEIDSIIDDVNASGYGLTFGLHTRIDSRVEHITSQLTVGNMYVNRNQIGAVVGSQPFGGEGMSGTGPKAGGPHYVSRFKREALPLHSVSEHQVSNDGVGKHGASKNSEANSESTSTNAAQFADVQSRLSAVSTNKHKPLQRIEMPGPTGESNQWSTYARGTILCLGPTVEDANEQVRIAEKMGCMALSVAPGVEGDNAVSGFLTRSALTELTHFDAVALWSNTEDLQSARQALSMRRGALLPLIATNNMHDLCVIERHLCVDTTAAGGNASLLAAQ